MIRSAFSAWRGSALVAALSLDRAMRIHTSAKRSSFLIPFRTALVLLIGAFGFAVAHAQPFAYITNLGSNDVSVIDTATNTVIATVPVGDSPHGVAVTPDGAFVYVTNFGGGVSVIGTASNTVVATVPVGASPYGVAVTPNGAFAYVTNSGSGTVSVIATASNTVVATIPVGTESVGTEPRGVAVTPNGAFVYVANADRTNSRSDTVSVIDTASNTVFANVPVGAGATGVAVTPDGAFVYVTNQIAGNDSVPSDPGHDTVQVIATASNTVVATITVEDAPVGVAVTPDGAFVYVANHCCHELSVISTASNTVVATVPVAMPVSIRDLLHGVAVTPDGAFAYVVVNDYYSSYVSVIDTATYAVVATVPAGNFPQAFGKFIGPPPKDADLQLVKSDSPDPVMVGDHLTYTLTVTNNGPAKATGVVLTDTLPPGVTFVSASPGEPTCQRTGGTVSCDLGTLARNARATVTMTVIASATGTISNTANVAANEPDPVATNNSATQGTTVSAVTCAGLAATIVGTPGNDVINGTSGNDVIQGLGGNDTINGLNGNDVICGGSGHDGISGGNGTDRLFGEGGNDVLKGNNGDDSLDGGPDTDNCDGGFGNDTGTGCETVIDI